MGLESEKLENCASCDRQPEVAGRLVRCATENCLLRSLMEWMSAQLWNETMSDFLLKKTKHDL